MNKKIKSAALLSILATSIIFAGCTSAVKVDNSKSKSDENIVIEKVETSKELLDSSEKENSDDKKLNEIKNLMDLNTIAGFKKFKLESSSLNYIEYSKAYKDSFGKIIEKLIDSDTLTSDENVYNYDDFEEKYHLEISNGSGMYVADIDANGEKDMIVVYKNAGSANYAGISGILLKSEEGYNLSSLKLEDDLMANDVDVLTYEGRVYICLSYGLLDEIYLWQDDKLLKIADESSFVDNSHIQKDRSLINDEIYKEFEVGAKLKELKNSEIDYTNSGYSNEEILISYFKIKKYINKSDKESLANHIMYPISFSENDILIKVYNKEQFIKNYDKIVTDDVKNILEESTYKDIFTSWRGAMIGNGEIWFADNIFAIN